MIEVRDLKKSFGPLPVLQGVTFSIGKGEAVSIIGVSGGGKSVLLKHLIGLMTPDAGEIHIDGRNIAGMDERQLLPVRRKFGMLVPGRGPVRFPEGGGQCRLRPPPRAPDAVRRKLPDASKRSWIWSGLSGIAEKDARRTFRRHAQAGRPGPRRDLPPGNPALRRADHRPGPDRRRHHRSIDHARGGETSR